MAVAAPVRVSVEADPSHTRAWYNLGLSYHRDSKWAEAMNAYQEAIRIKPDFGSSYKMSYIFALRGDYEKAMSWIDEHIAQGPSNAIKAWGSILKAIYFHM